MNLRGMVNKFTQNTNPNTVVTWKQSNGYKTNAAGKREPLFITLTVPAQIQALSTTDLNHTNGLNIVTMMRSVYMYGNALAVARTDQVGGDILLFPEVPGTSDKTWLITTVVETWPDWCHVIVTLQKN